MTKKIRSPKRNALISFIPIYGLSSYFYLGWHHGLSAFLLGQLINIVILMTPALFSMASVDALTMIAVFAAYPLMFVIQYLLVKHYTVKRNAELNK